MSRKYYYLKLKDNFFESNEIILLESMPEGHKYSNILLKLYLKSLKNEGKLMLTDRIPFNVNMLAQVTRHSTGDVEKALKLFEELNFVEVLDTGAIYMLDIQNFIGESSTEADRKRLYRNKIESEKKALGQTEDKCPDKCPTETSANKSFPQVKDKCPTEIEIEKEIELERDISRAYTHEDAVNEVRSTDGIPEKNITKTKQQKEVRHKYGEYNHVMLTKTQYEKLIADFGEKITHEYIKRADEYCQQHGKSYKDYNLTIRNWINKANVKPNANKPKYEFKASPDF